MSTAPKRSPDLERIVMDPTESFHWNAHDFPCDIARWNYHPECEVHLVRRSEGTAFVGDYIGPFQPGNLMLVGPNLPHHWESDRRPGEVVHLRDVALHFDPGLIHRAAQAFPEMAEVEPLMKDAERGLQFHGEAARRGAPLLERIGVESGVQRLLRFVDLLHLLAHSSDRESLASVGYLPNLDREAPPVVQKIMQYILANIDGQVRMAEAARLTGMSEPTFCRFFKRNTGNNFVGYVRKLRIGAACKLLVESSLPITDICYEVGYQNVSNFNRHFRTEKGVTPSRYRQLFMYRGEGAKAPRPPNRAPAPGGGLRERKTRAARVARPLD
jgi:AraC-like DNA-binding protein